MAGGAGWVQADAMFGCIDNVATRTIGRRAELVMNYRCGSRGGAMERRAVGRAGMAIFAEYRSSGEFASGNGVDHSGLGAGVTGEAVSFVDVINYACGVMAGRAIGPGDIRVGGVRVGEGSPVTGKAGPCQDGDHVRASGRVRQGWRLSVAMAADSFMDIEN